MPKTGHAVPDLDLSSTESCYYFLAPVWFSINWFYCWLLAGFCYLLVYILLVLLKAGSALHEALGQFSVQAEACIVLTMWQQQHPLGQSYITFTFYSLRCRRGISVFIWKVFKTWLFVCKLYWVYNHLVGHLLIFGVDHKLGSPLTTLSIAELKQLQKAGFCFFLARSSPPFVSLVTFEGNLCWFQVRSSSLMLWYP